jgi:hypothetical protein
LQLPLLQHVKSCLVQDVPTTRYVILSVILGGNDSCNVVGVGLGADVSTAPGVALGAEARAVFVVGARVGILVDER